MDYRTAKRVLRQIERADSEWVVSSFLPVDEERYTVNRRGGIDARAVRADNAPSLIVLYSRQTNDVRTVREPADWTALEAGR